jgi:hypothetical protein
MLNWLLSNLRGDMGAVNSLGKGSKVTGVRFYKWKNTGDEIEKKSIC